MKFNVIVCTDKYNGIANINGIPWKIKEELNYFKEETKDSIVIMGKRTWFDIIKKCNGPLPFRTNIVISSTIKNTIYDEMIFASLTEAFDYINNSSFKDKQIFIIGGQELYKEALTSYIDNCVYVYHNKIDTNYNCNRFFYQCDRLNLISSVQEVHCDHIIKKNVNISYNVYGNVRNEEEEYLDLLRKIITNGTIKNDRTGTGTKSIFGSQLKFNIRNGKLPLLTTKKVPIRLIIEELLWMLRGETDANLLKEKNVHIWDGNTSREFLDKQGLHYLPEGSIGEGYGWQWRHWNAKYGDPHDGFDQLAECIRLIKEEPTSRRILFHAWNVSRLKEMALVPCHILYQFYVNNSELSCSMYQRSADVFLGLPFNIASTSILTIIMANLTGLKTGDITISIGDAHLYLNHMEQAITQLEREPLGFPTIELTKKINNLNDLIDITPKDFILNNYNSHSAIKAQMAI